MFLCSVPNGHCSSANPKISSAAALGLGSITHISQEHRATLRNVIIGRLHVLASDDLLAYIARVTPEWLGPDLLADGDFQSFFSLVMHKNRTVQSAAMLVLRDQLRHASFRQSLQKADFVSRLRKLVDSENSDVLEFVADSLATMALELARARQIPVILQFLTESEPVVRRGARDAICNIASAEAPDSGSLIQEGIIERLSGNQIIEHVVLDVLDFTIPTLAIQYVTAGRVNAILSLVE